MVSDLEYVYLKTDDNIHMKIMAENKGHMLLNILNDFESASHRRNRHCSNTEDDGEINFITY